MRKTYSANKYEGNLLIADLLRKKFYNTFFSKRTWICQKYETSQINKEC